MPCWDEPDFKATFDLAVNAPAGDMVVGNMPAASTGDLGNGMKQVVFQTTPRMSTYLLFMAMGDFDRSTIRGENGTDGKPVEIGVIAQKGKGRAGALRARSQPRRAARVQRLLRRAVPVAEAGQHRRAGPQPVLQRDGELGRDLHLRVFAAARPGHRQRLRPAARIFTVAAHEIAHQWFGDLVTMAWWDDLWLNEGFATWMEGRTTRKLHPEWDIDGVDAASPAAARWAAMPTPPPTRWCSTSRRWNRPARPSTASPTARGSAVIGMLEDYVGADAWREGVRSYIRKHAYGNAVTDDLWREVDQAAPGRQLMQVAHDFTLQPGVPLIKASTVCEAGATRVVLEQGEFTVDRPGKTPLRWHVPVSVRGGDGSVVRVLVDGQASATLPGCGAPVVVNAGQKGYYRTLYAPQQFRALRDGYTRLPVVDQLRGDARRQRAGADRLQPEADLLDLADQVPLDASPDLWQLVAGVLGGIDEMFKGQPERQAAFLQVRAVALVAEVRTVSGGKAAKAIRPRSGSAHQPDRHAQRHGRREGGRRGAPALRRGGERSRGDAAGPAQHGAGHRRLQRRRRDLGQAACDGARRTVVDDPRPVLRVLARAKDKALAQRALDMALTDEPGATNGAGMISAVSWEHPDMAFDFAVAHREQVDKLVDTTSRARYYPGLGSGANDLAMVGKIRAFADKHIAPTSRRSAETAIAAIQTRLKLRALQQPQVEAWLRQKARLGFSHRGTRHAPDRLPRNRVAGGDAGTGRRRAAAGAPSRARRHRRRGFARIAAPVRRRAGRLRHAPHLSDTRSDSRGIGAARRWVKAQFEHFSADCGGCLEVVTPSRVFTGKRMPAAGAGSTGRGRDPARQQRSGSRGRHHRPPRFALQRRDGRQNATRPAPTTTPPACPRCSRPRAC